MTQVFQLSNLPQGHTHQLDHGNFKVLLTNVDGEVYAVESKCSHFSLPLEHAALCEHRLRCPFHHACFDVRTGAQIEAPGLDGIATFEVEVRDGGIYLGDQPKSAPTPFIAPAAAPEQEIEHHFKYAIVGGGVAAANAVYGIREYDKDGSIVMITSEDLPPYDRTHVSKALLAGDKKVEDLPLHGEEFYQQQGVKLLEKTVVEKADVLGKTITAGETTLTYDKVLLATGGTPRKMDVPGAKLGGIYTIRNARDGRRLSEQVKKGMKVVVVGGSFIGLEAAMSLCKQGGLVTVVTPEETLFAGPFGEKIGKWIQQLHEKAGVRFRLGEKVKEFLGTGKVSAAVLESGDEVKAEMVVIGIGVQPATSYLEGLASNNDGGIKVDNHLATNVADTWVAGDIAEYPARTGATRIEHWKVAAQQGRVAGRNMAGHAEPYTMIPYFWSNQQGTNLRYVGHADDYDEILFDGEPGEGPFIAYYIKDGHLLAALGVKRDGEVAKIGERMNAGTLPKTEELLTTKW